MAVTTPYKQHPPETASQPLQQSPATPGPAGSSFVFLIGAAVKHYPVPCESLARVSPVLGQTVRDARSSLTTPCAYLPDCDEPTFERFLAFLLTGDFPSPLFRAVPPGRWAERYCTQFLPPPPFNASRAACRTFAKFAGTRRYARVRRLKFDNAWETNVDDTGEFALCAVARVYLLAERYEVAALRRLCLHKLHRLIVSVREIWDGVHFLRLCAALSPPLPKERSDELRRLAYFYCLFHYADLEPRAEFAAFMAETPEFAMAIMDGLAKFNAEDMKELYVGLVKETDMSRGRALPHHLLYCQGRTCE